ncbi:hypothetical protein LR48_Vigan07g034400 [Vigna angularis]|uniref:Uncharacterized protein n=1 Tax=Phaseolus angularis TaxID=3914 RepID=A0A0L9UUU2_PHAAN|nr:hypothetical protein LR48_Vigan07g034400 [Vigna angularis]
MMADEGFGYACFLDCDGSAIDDDKFCIDLETVISVLDEDNDRSEEVDDGGEEVGDKEEESSNGVVGRWVTWPKRRPWMAEGEVEKRWTREAKNYS